MRLPAADADADVLSSFTGIPRVQEVPRSPAPLALARWTAHPSSAFSFPSTGTTGVPGPQPQIAGSPCSLRIPISNLTSLFLLLELQRPGGHLTLDGPLATLETKCASCWAQHGPKLGPVSMLDIQQRCF